MMKTKSYDFYFINFSNYSYFILIELYKSSAFFGYGFCSFIFQMSTNIFDSIIKPDGASSRIIYDKNIFF